ncbi:hypothetical protein LTR56_016365 [Elasticomyces elasticus]|nr:hypothetical protein LTR56_016365 [Elasticomyces elasticus]KAK3643683.1 hypothetical protein LTR22_015601 [Elasticomyces elasticus]KAK4915145.1 hypothetical protein LTR49_016654 [Elasticomyces elasticus]KAK5749301.1 hypothetical protein LTS12_020619 [Elasticomyces elasticus]
MPSTRPRASFVPISPHFDLKKLVESTPNFSFVDRISCDMIDQQGIEAFEKLVLLHVVMGGKPLVIDGYEDRLDPWTFSQKWIRDNCGEEVTNARNLTSHENLPLTMGHYMKNMGKLTNQFFEVDGAHKDKNRQRVYLKDIDCPAVWQDKVKEQIPGSLFYMNDSTGEVGGPGAAPDPTSTVRRLGKGVARAGDLMSSLPPEMRAENLMCYIGHEGTYTPAHREMCASLGQNIMVEASGTVSDDAQAEKPGSSIWFMTETKDRHIVSEYFLSELGHDIEVEKHFAQVIAWKKAPFNVYVVEQKPGDFILIPPLAPHQVWNRGTRTMKVAWNRTTVETLEMALNEALPRSRIVCRDEQYKNKAIIYYTLQKYSGQLSLAQQQSARMPVDAAREMLYTGKIKQLQKDFKRLFALYRQILLSEMFTPEDRDAPRNMEYLPFDSNVTCAYCRGNVFNRFLTCHSCKYLLGHHADDADGDPYDVCLDCYAMGRSCGCLSGMKWVEQFRWKELQSKYEAWRKLIIALDGGQVTDKTPLTLIEERRRYPKKTLAEVCKEQLKRRPFKDVNKPAEVPKGDDDNDEEIIVGDDGTVKKITKKKPKAWLKENTPCHVCCHRHPNWKMAFCTKCERGWCYGSLFRGWDKMPMEIMEDPDWNCPHCLGICFAGACRREGKMTPYEPKGTLLGHDTRIVADARSVEALVDFSVSNLNWLKDDDPADRTNTSRVKRAKAEAQRAKEVDPTVEDEDVVDQTHVDFEYSHSPEGAVDPALNDEPQAPRGDDEDDDSYLMRALQVANSTLPPPAAMVAGVPATTGADGYVPVAPPATMYPQPTNDSSYAYPGYARPSSVTPIDEAEEIGGLRPFRKRQRDDEEDYEDINMQKHPKAKKPRMSGAGFRSSDLADPTMGSKARTEAQRQFENAKEQKALARAKTEGRFIMLQAKLRGKKRIVKLKVPSEKLRQFELQQAAKTALNAGEEADAEHEVVEGAAPEEDTVDPLLISDLAPRKTQNPKAYNEKREREGLVVTGSTRKALIPVEKDDSYGYAQKERLPSGKRVNVSGIKRKGRASTMQYEEVDIGSDEEENEEDMHASNQAATSARERRALPEYLQNRHAGEQEDMPDELPSTYKEGRGRPTKAKSAVIAVDADEEAAAAENRTPVPASSRPMGRPAGKRPSMRPPAAQSVDLGDAADEDEVNEVINATVNGTFMDIDEALSIPNPSTSKAMANGTPRTATSSARPASNGKASTGRPRGRVSETGPSLAKQHADEQNRLAKLQALDMVTGIVKTPTARAGGQASVRGGRAGGPTTVSMADALSDEESDDGIDAVPAKASMRA